MSLLTLSRSPRGWLRPTLVLWALILQPEQAAGTRIAADAAAADVRVSAAKAVVP